MTELIQFSESGVLVQIHSAEEGIKPTSVADKPAKILKKTLKEVLETCGIIATEFSEVCKPLLDGPLESADIEVGFQFTAFGSLYVVEVEGQAAIKARFTYK